jgi:hypothetical protein
MTTSNAPGLGPVLAISDLAGEHHHVAVTHDLAMEHHVAVTNKSFSGGGPTATTVTETVTATGSETGRLPKKVRNSQVDLKLLLIAGASTAALGLLLKIMLSKNSSKKVSN